MSEKLGSLEEIKDLRKAWPHEARDFTPWLADNIGELGKVIGIDIDVDETESSVGGFNADIFATDADTGKRIIIENQLEDTDHKHLGQLITYASGKSASLVIWVVKHAREEHRSAIEWLNNHTDEEIGFILCEIKLFRIGTSALAPHFNIIEQPNNWAKGMKSSKEKAKLPTITDLLEWEVVQPGDIITDTSGKHEAVLLENGHISYDGNEYSLQKWLKSIHGWSSVETYKYSIHKATGKPLSKLRAEYMDSHKGQE